MKNATNIAGGDVSAMAELRAATWPAHQRLEKRVDVKSRFSSVDAYRSHLEQMWGFCAALEMRLEPSTFEGALADYGSRRKLPSLTRDLIALGADSGLIDKLARCESVPDCGDPSAAFGCVYVFEGATLGGRSLLPVVESRLGLTAAHGASFLASYGDDVTAMWRRFGAALDAWCGAQERRARAVAAAVATFDSLDEWLCGSRHE
jgi:heme oxygenase